MVGTKTEMYRGVSVINYSLTNWFLYRCQGYIKARMKSEKRRTRFHSGHGTVYDVFYCLCVFYHE